MIQQKAKLIPRSTASILLAQSSCGLTRSASWFLLAQPQNHERHSSQCLMGHYGLPSTLCERIRFASYQ